MPRVSVLMPAYNVEKYVGEAIESILNQTYKDFEFIIINDGSTDNTAKIIQEYAKKDKRIKFINNKKNQGFIARLNDCLDIASGDYVAKMDSDDISLPERLEKQVNFLDNNPEFGMVGAGLKKIGYESNVDIRPKVVGLLDLLYKTETTVFMARREIIEKYNLRFDKDYFAAEDHEFYARFSCVAKIANLQEILYLYRFHDTNVSSQKHTQLQHTDELIKKHYADILTGNKYIFDKLTKMYRWIKICGLPIIKIKTYNMQRSKYYLFGKIPLIMVENGKIFLFGFLKIGAIK